MSYIKKIFVFATNFKYGYKITDKIKIFLHNMLLILAYPVNRISFLLLNKNVFQPKVFFKQFIVSNSDGIFICRDNIDVDIVSESFEREIRKVFKDFKEGIFVDIGANIGKYTVMIGNQLKGNGKIISIEPHPNNFEILKKNVEVNKCENVTLVNAACWNTKSTLKLFDHEAHPLLASAVKESKNFITVDSEPLDDILDRLGVKNVDLVKIDVEGAESKVLEGMKNLLKIGKVRIVFEAWDNSFVDACRKVLEVYNYKIEQLNSMYWIGDRS